MILYLISVTFLYYLFNPRIVVWGWFFHRDITDWVYVSKNHFIGMGPWPFVWRRHGRQH